MAPTRQIYWNIAYGWLVCPLMLAVLAALAYGFWRRWRVWWRGAHEDPRPEWRARLRALVAYGLGQARVVRSPFAGTMHLLLYGGFVTLFIGTLLIAAQEDLRVHFLYGDFYLFYSLILDIFGVVALVGVAGLAWRRYVQRPAALDSHADDAITLAGLAIILVTGYLIEGLRIGATELQTDPALARWSPVGLATARVLLGVGVPLDAFPPLHRALWWGHALLVFAWLGYWAWSKMRHVLLVPANAFLRPQRPFGALRPIADFNDPAQLGLETFANLSFRERLSADTCIHAGRCQDNCPAYVSGKPLNPKALIVNLQAIAARVRDCAAAAEAAPLTEQALSEEGVWACTTCGACNYHCPVLVEPMDAIAGMRRNLVLAKGKVPTTAQAALVNIQRRGHPWSGTRLTRTDWMKGLDVPLLADKPDAEVLFWVGCAGALVERNVKTTRAMARLLQQAGVDFAVLGDEETCTGDPARRLGNEFLYQQQARKNLKTFADYRIKKVVATCPHCFHTLKNEYPMLGGNLEVVHHTEFLAELVAQGRLRPARDVPQTITYHDPCYLGRYNRVYDPPRDVVSALTGARQVEMPRCREKGFCCGAGGGHAFMEEQGGQRINYLRSQEAVDTGADALVSACPFCLQMFDEGVKAVAPDGRMQTLDLAELLEQALAPAPSSSD
ncbi:MAG TPA: heterodisulfide reductase-related iron-sulfur binding cluster [Chloroflexota bacterium]|jgi:Fe-S oxidoreductase/nitrate reductase gamma subunit